MAFKDGLASFLSTWSGVHTAFSFNQTNANTGTDSSHDANSSTYGQADTANYPNYGLAAYCNPDSGGDMDIYIITDACMLLYIPENLATDEYALFHNGGGTHGQMGQLRSQNNGETITLGITHNANGTQQDYTTVVITERGWVCIGFQFEDNSGNMAIWVNGVNKAEIARTYALAYGSGNPRVGDGNADGIPGWTAREEINGTGMLIANFVCDNPDNDNSNPAGCGDDFYTDYYDEHLAAAGVQVNATVIAAVGAIIAPTIKTAVQYTATLLTALGSILAPTEKTAVKYEPTAIVAQATVNAPGVQIGTSFDATAITAEGTVNVPIEKTAVKFNGTAVAGLGTVNSPAAKTGVVFDGTTIAGLGTIVAPSVEISTGHVATVITGQGTILSPIVKTAVSYDASAISAIGTFNYPSIKTAVIYDASLISAFGTINSPPIKTAVKFNASAVAGLGTIYAPVIQVAGGNIYVNATVISADGTVLSPTIKVGTFHNASLITVVGSINAPSIKLGAEHRATVLAGSGNVLNPTTKTAVVYMATVVPGISEVNAPIIHIEYGIQVEPTVITAGGTILHPIARHLWTDLGIRDCTIELGIIPITRELVQDIADATIELEIKEI